MHRYIKNKTIITHYTVQEEETGNGKLSVKATAACSWGSMS